MESMNILQILATVLSVVRHLMDLVLTVHLANTCMEAMEGSANSVVQHLQAPAQTVHTENMKDNLSFQLMPDLFQLAGALYRLKGEHYGSFSNEKSI